jgi:predicted unusual protein kinase regulating ubiquinone biosynthesis (AarF/ABC1/UbiB family)
MLKALRLQCNRSVPLSHSFSHPLSLSLALSEQIVDDAFKDGIKLRNSGVSQLLHRVLNLCYKHRVRLESNFSAVILSIGVIEGLGIQLDPDADVVMRAAPYILRTAARDYGLL